MATLHGRYTAADLLKLELQGGTALIEGLLWEQDTVLLVGKEKAGKSILGLQLACALSSGSSFLGQFDVPKPVHVAYVQAEGKLYNTKSNLTRMMTVIPCGTDRLAFFYYPCVALDTMDALAELMRQINAWQKPDVIIVDPLYMAMAGDMKDDVDSRRMIANLRTMAETYKSTMLVIHHAKRPSYDPKSGEIRAEGDDATFGSFVWKAYPDNLFLLEKKTGKMRRFIGATQRMDKAPTDLHLTLYGSGKEQDALYFALDADPQSADHQLLKHIPWDHTQQTIGRAELEDASELSKPTVWRHLNSLKGQGLIGDITVGNKQVWYRFTTPGTPAKNA